MLIVSAVDLAAIEDHEAASKEAAATIVVVCGSGFVPFLALPQDDMGPGFTFSDPGIERLPLLKGRPRSGFETARFSGSPQYEAIDSAVGASGCASGPHDGRAAVVPWQDRKSTRLNSSH